MSDAQDIYQNSHVFGYDKCTKTSMLKDEAELHLLKHTNFMYTIHFAIICLKACFVWRNNVSSRFKNVYILLTDLIVFCKTGLEIGTRSYGHDTFVHKVFLVVTLFYTTFTILLFYGIS